MVGVGYVIRRVNWLSEHSDASLMRVVVNVFTPCLIADTILGNPVFARLDNVLLPPLMGFATTAAGFGIGWLTRRWPRSKAGVGGERTYALTVGLCNYGYIPIPLAQVLFSAGTMGVLFVQNIGVELAMWLLGLALVSGRSWREGSKYLLNPPVLAIVGTLLLNALIPRALIPAAILGGAHLLGQCSIPLGLVLIGATIADVLPELREHQGLRLVGVACLIRLVVMPVVILSIASVLPLSMELKQVMLLHAAMPSAVFPIVMARHFGGDAGTALRIVLGTSIASLVTMPLWLKAGLLWLGMQHGLLG